jgi:hypothetical protein
MASDYNAGTMLFNYICKEAKDLCQWAAEYLAFSLFNSANKAGVDNLNPELTIGGVTETPMFRYKGGDASATGWPKWTYGEDLNFVSAGTNPTYNAGSPCLGSNDDSVKFNAGDYFEGDNTTFGNIGTDDIVIEIVAQINGSSLNYLGAKRVSYNQEGWGLFSNSSLLHLAIEDTSSSVKVLSSTSSFSMPQWVHVLVFIDRNENSTNGGKLFINGVLEDSENFSTLGTTDGSSAMTFGASDGGTYRGKHNVAYAAMWKKSDWMQGGATNATEWDAIAEERFAKVSGRYPLVAKGDPTPITTTRATAAFLDKVESGKIRLYKMGSEWMRQCHRQDTNGVDVYGFLPELQSTNLITESKDLTTWTKLDAGDSVDVDAATGPDTVRLKDGIIADTTDGEHGFSRAVTLTAAKYAFSCFFEPGDQDWFYLSDDTVSGAWCYFNGNTGAVGSSGSGATGYIEGPFADDSYRGVIVLTGTAASHTLKVQVAQADNDKTFAGNGSTTNGYFWGLQIEQSDYMTSPIETAGSTVTRVKDNLRFEANDNIGGAAIEQGTVVLDILLPDYDQDVDRCPFSLGNPGITWINWQVIASNQRPYAYIGGAGDTGEVNVSTDISDGEKHNVKCKWAHNNLQLNVDGGTYSVDNVVDIPDDLSNMGIGMAHPGTFQINGLVANVWIYPVETEGCG